MLLTQNPYVSLTPSKQMLRIITNLILSLLYFISFQFLDFVCPFLLTSFLHLESAAWINALWKQISIRSILLGWIIYLFTYLSI